MSEGVRRRATPDAVWAEVRKAWEGGETARSVAKRYDVGVPALWKRREAEGWKRPETRFGPIEPAEGWDALAERRMRRFLSDLETQRELALGLLAALEGGRFEELSAWHLGFYYRWRAERLGAEVGAADRARVGGQTWARAVWEPDGRLMVADDSDRAIMALFRDDWRRQAGLPDGAAESWPCPAPGGADAPGTGGRCPNDLDPGGGLGYDPGNPFPEPPP